MNKYQSIAISVFVLLSSSSTLHAQSFGIDLEGEVQTDFRGGYNMVSYLRLDTEFPLSEHLSFQFSTLTLGQLHPDQLVPDHQTYSNLEVGNHLLNVAVAGFGWQINDRHYLFAGIRPMDDDYFMSEVTNFFTNSSCGIFPTLSANYPINIFPVTTVGLHYIYQREQFVWQASAYNGIAYERLSGQDNIFRFCPASDGMQFFTQGEYIYQDSHYFIGGSLYARGKSLRQEMSASLSPTMWTYAEQQITPSLTLIADYAHAFGPESECSDFAGFGGRLKIGRNEVGLFTDYARFSETEEWATELTFHIPIFANTYLQPTLHYIVNESHRVAGLLRFVYLLE